MRVLILGGYGFVGSNLADALIERGNEVRIFDKTGADNSRINHLSGKVEILEGDFAVASDASRALKGMEAVVHLACTTIPATSNKDPIYDVETNLVGTIQLLDQTLKYKIRRFVFASTGGAVYGPPQKMPIAEDHPTYPISSYGIHKLIIEKYLSVYEKLHGLNWVALRPSNPYGKRQRPDTGQGAATAFAHAMKLGKEITIWGDGSVVRDYIHISDLARAYAMALERETPSRIYNIGTGKGTNLKELVKLLAKVSGIKPKVRYGPARPYDVPSNALDCSRAKKELGWEPTISLEEGLREYFEED